MKDNCILTAESVTEGHPDKLCDTIADAVVDACLTQDAAARVACEVMATAGKIIAAGEITAAKIPDIPAIICRTVREAGYGGNDYEVEVITHEQSPDIAEAVCGGTETGAGDQGILYGFACDETKELLPLPVVLAHRLTRLLTDTRRQGIIPGLRPDGKAQVSVEYRSGVPCRVAAVVVSCQHEEELPLPELRRDILRHVIRPAMQELPLDEHNAVLLSYANSKIEELDTHRQALTKEIAALSAEIMSPEQIERLSVYLNQWEEIDFEDRRQVADGLISQIRATDEHVSIEWKI